MAFVSGFMGFTKSERRGLIVLSGLIVLFVILNHLAVSDTLFSSPNNPKKADEVSLLLASADSMEANYERHEGYQTNRKNYSRNKSSNNYKQRKRYGSYKSRNSQKIEYFSFDPNTLDETGWQALGFSEKQAKAMVSYMRKAQPFTKPEDLLKLFTIDSAKFLQLKPYVVFQETTTEDDHSEPVIIQVNQGLEEDFKKIPGMNKYLAERIVRYRNALGGFISEAQLLEVKGMRSTLLDSLLPYLNYDFGVLQMINVNTADAATIKRHPYCNDWKIARTIADTRDQFGPYKRVEELLRLPGIEKTWFERIRPYLILNDE